MELYLDEKWKLSKKGSSSSSRRSSSSSLSWEGAYLKRQSSMAKEEGRKGRRRSHPHPHPHTHQRSFTRRWSTLVKEQRARFYIMRRCVTMLICWTDYP